MSAVQSGELAVALLCEGLRLDPAHLPGPSVRLYGLPGKGQTIELVVPGDLKDLWLNIPVDPAFAGKSPFLLQCQGSQATLVNEPSGERVPVTLPPLPEWFHRPTCTGRSMGQVGLLHGTQLSLYLRPGGEFWRRSLGCKLAPGLLPGGDSTSLLNLEEAVEVAYAAKEQSGCTYVHITTALEKEEDLDVAAPYVKAIKERVGALVGVQTLPTLQSWKYSWLADLGVDHFAFIYDCRTEEAWKRFEPGPVQEAGRRAFLPSLDPTVKLLNRGAVAGVLVAGLEPAANTLSMINEITSRGAFPEVFPFRPHPGTPLEGLPRPRWQDLVPVFRQVYESCRANGVPIGLAPNIEVSLFLQPVDTKLLAPRDWKFKLYEGKLKMMKLLAMRHFNYQLQPRMIDADPANPNPYREGGEEETAG